MRISLALSCVLLMTCGALGQANRVILFDGKDTSQWVSTKTGAPCPWKVVDEALEATSKAGDIQTKEKYFDYTLHVEFRTPTPEPGQTGQHRGNSGVYLSNKYEVQVLDSYGIEPPTKNDCGSLYNHRAPDKNLCKAPREWQTYEITFRAPRWDADNKKKIENARITVIWNGEKVHDNYEIPGPTRSGDKEELIGPQVIRLQDHGHPVQFRNIWIEPKP